MFRDDRQIAACARVLLARVGLAYLWALNGPTERACEMYDASAGGGPLSSGERAMLLLAFALWNGGRHLVAADLLSLDDGNLAAVGTLLSAVAMGSEAVDVWLHDHGEGA